jgi:peptidoglycan/LPS O-acetylase OafA/YrhL
VLLTKLRVTSDKKIVEYNVGRNLALLLIALLLIGGAILMWSNHQNAPAQALFSLGEAIVVGGFGVAYGEKRGALAAGAKTDQRP